MLIDFHIHVFPDDLAKKAIPKLAKTSDLLNQTDGTVSDTLLKMDEWSVDKAVFLNTATKPNQEDTINHFALSVNNPRLIPFAAVHYNSEKLEKVIEKIKNQGFFGVKFHPDYENCMVDDKALDLLYDLCSEYRLMLMFHAGVDFISPNLVHGTPKMFLTVHKRFPKLKMILAHLGGYSMWEDVYDLLAGKNIYMDTAMCSGNIDPNLMKQILSKHDPDKILFGSDCPWQSSKENFDFMKTLGLSDERLEKIAYQNAENLLLNAI